MKALHVLLLAVAVGCDADPEAPAVETDSDGETGDEADDAESSGDEGVDAEIVCEDEPVITYDTFGRGFLASYCNGCHGSAVLDRKGAPSTVVFDDRETVSMFAERIFLRIDPGDDPTPPMPPAGGVTLDDLERARIWLTCYP